jgi:hypothetical protein
MSGIKKTDLATASFLAFDFFVALPATNYPLWTVRSGWFRASLYVAFWLGALSAIGLPVWVGVRLFRGASWRLLIFVEFVGAVSWLAAFTYIVISSFPAVI